MSQSTPDEVNLGEELIDKIGAVFKEHDAKGSGTIKSKELSAVLRTLDANRWDDASISGLFAAMNLSPYSTIAYDDMLKLLFKKDIPHHHPSMHVASLAVVAAIRFRESLLETAGSLDQVVDDFVTDDDDLELVADLATLPYANRMPQYSEYDAPPWTLPFNSNFKAFRSARITAHMKRLLSNEVAGIPGWNFTQVFDKIMADVGCNIYVIGGEVRDAVAGKESMDTDMGFTCKVEDLRALAEKEGWAIAACMPERAYISLGAGGDTGLEGKTVWMNGPPFSPGWNLEYCANTLAWDVRNDLLLDPTGSGVSDVRLDIVRIPGDRSTWRKWLAREPAQPLDPLGGYIKTLRLWKMALKGYRFDLATYHFVLRELYISFEQESTEIEGYGSVPFAQPADKPISKAGFTLPDKVVYFFDHFRMRADQLSGLMRNQMGHDKNGCSWFDRKMQPLIAYTVSEKAMEYTRTDKQELYRNKPALTADNVSLGPAIWRKVVVAADGTCEVRAATAADCTDWEAWVAQTEPMPIPTMKG